MGGRRRKEVKEGKKEGVLGRKKNLSHQSFPGSITSESRDTSDLAPSDACLLNEYKEERINLLHYILRTRHTVGPL